MPRYHINLQRCFSCLFIIIFFGVVLSVAKMVYRVSAADEERIVKVGIYDNSPKVFLNEGGFASGLFPDVLEYIADQEDWQLEYVFGTWEEGLERLELGEVDVMVDVALTDVRLDKFDFTNETLLNSWGVIYAYKDAVIDSWRSLDGKKIAILGSSVYLGGPLGVDTYIQAFGLESEFVKVEGYAEVFDLLNRGEVDAAVVSRISGLANQTDYPNIKETNIFFNPTEIRFALTKDDSDNPYLIERLDYWVKRLTEGYDGIYRQIWERYGLEGMIASEVITPPWVIPIVISGAVIIFLALLLIIRLLKKRADSLRELRESEIKFRSLYESMMEMVVLAELVKDKDGKVIDYKVVDCNPSYLKVIGREKERAIGRLASTLNDAAAVPYLSIYTDVVESGDPHRFEAFLPKINRYWDISAFKFGSDKFCVVATDITERKMSEEAIKERNIQLENLTRSQEERKIEMQKMMEDLGKAKEELERGKAKDEAILASIGEGLIAVDKNGRILIMNKAAENILGLKNTDMLGHHVSEIPLEEESGHMIPTNRRPTAAAIASGKGIQRTYFSLRKDKTRFPIALNVTPIKLDGEIIGAVDIFRDITAELEVDRAKSEFVSLASHQLRTPLGIIKWYLEALEREVYIKKAPKIVQEHFEEVSKNNERVLSLVRDLLSVSRIEQDRVKDNPEVVDPKKIIEEVVDQMQIIAKKKKIDLHLIIKSGKVPSINIDVLRFHQVLENLITNALEYTPSPGRVDVIVKVVKNTLMISVKDTGIGVSPEDQKKLFTKFFRTEEAVGQDPEGSGLGLYVVKSYMEGWGGSVSVESKVGKGSTFTIALPVNKLSVSKRK